MNQRVKIRNTNIICLVKDVNYYNNHHMNITEYTLWIKSRDLDSIYSFNQHNIYVIRPVEGDYVEILAEEYFITELTPLERLVFDSD